MQRMADASLNITDDRRPLRDAIAALRVPGQAAQACGPHARGLYLRSMALGKVLQSRKTHEIRPQELSRNEMASHGLAILLIDAIKLESLWICMPAFALTSAVASQHVYVVEDTLLHLSGAIYFSHREALRYHRVNLPF